MKISGVFVLSVVLVWFIVSSTLHLLAASHPDWNFSKVYVATGH